MMKNNTFVWIVSVICAALFASALIFTRGALRVILCTAAAAGWMVLFLRFCTLRYHISDDEIRVNIGLFFHSRITVKRSAILSQSRLYFGRHLICTIVRTAGETVILFCEIPDI